MFTDELEQSANIENANKITIINQQIIYIEDIKTVLAVSCEQVILRLDSKKILTINGSNLQLQKLQPKICAISGKIQSLLFEG